MHLSFAHVLMCCLVSGLALACKQVNKRDAEKPAARPALAKPTCDLGQDGWRQWFATELSRFEASQYSLNGAYIGKRIAECLDEILTVSPLGINLENLKSLTQKMLNFTLPGQSMGLAITDEQYTQSSPIAGSQNLPAILNDQQFFAALDAGSFNDGFIAASRWLDATNNSLPVERRLLYFPYLSQHLPTIDDSQSYGRFLVYVPNDNVDVFVQFGVRDNPLKPLPNGVSLIAIVKRDAQGQVLAEPQAFFNDLWRLRQPSGTVLSTRLKETGAMESCYGCHSSALVPIVPDPRFFDVAKSGSALSLVEKVMAKYANASMPHFDTQSFGPPLGPVDSPQRTMAFIKSCSGKQDLNEDSVARIQSAMNCSSCHDDVKRRALRLPMAGFKQLSKDSLIKQFVEVFKTMPPGATLDASERSALVLCLSVEYLDSSADRSSLMRKWLTEG